MNYKQRVFVEEYLKCWNATEAARRAGYAEKYLHTNANKLLQNTTVKEAIEARIEELKMSTDEVLLRLAEHARSDVGKYINVLPGGQAIINLEQAKEAKALHLIKKLKVTKLGPEIELYDQQAALQLIGKHLGLFKDTTTNLNVDMSQLTTEQLERIAKGEDVYHVLATSSGS